MMSVYCSICEYESDLCSNEHYLRSTMKIRPEKNSGIACTGFEFFCLFLFVCLFFSGLLFTTAQVVFITAKIAFISRLYPQFTYMIFIYSQSFQLII